MKTTKVRDQENLKVRLAPQDADQIRYLAGKNERSVAAELRMAVRFYLDQKWLAAQQDGGK
jgi:hypothetical protein